MSNHHAPGTGNGWKRDAERARERANDAEHALRGLREQLAAHRTTIAALEDDNARLRAALEESRAAECHERETADVARRTVRQLRDLLEVLDPIAEPGCACSADGR